MCIRDRPGAGFNIDGPSQAGCGLEDILYLGGTGIRPGAAVDVQRKSEWHPPVFQKFILSGRRLSVHEIAHVILQQKGKVCIRMRKMR